jgi:hypothetical protein
MSLEDMFGVVVVWPLSAEPLIGLLTLLVRCIDGGG